MAGEQAVGPGATPENPTAAVEPAKDDVLTGAKTAEGTAPLAKGAAPELPRAWMPGMTREQQADADLVKNLSKFERGIPDLVQAYVELEKRAGRSIVIPNDKSTPEEKAAFAKAIGVPEKPSDYKLEELKLPRGVTKADTDALEQKILKIAQDAGLTQGQFATVRKSFFVQVAEGIKSRLEAMPTPKECEETLKRQYADQYPAAIEMANRAYDKYAPEPLRAKLAAAGFANDPDMVRIFVELGKRSGEAPFVEGKGATAATTPVGKRNTMELASVMYGNGSKES